MHHTDRRPASRAGSRSRNHGSTLLRLLSCLLAPTALAGGCQDSPCEAICDCVEAQSGEEGREICEEQCAALEDGPNPRAACQAALSFNGVEECSFTCDDLSSGPSGPGSTSTTGTGGSGGSGAAPSSSNSSSSSGTGGGNGGGSSSSSSSSSSGGGSAASCQLACPLLYDCGVEDGNCPGFTGNPSEKQLFVDVCLNTCASNPALAGVVDPNDCSGTVAVISSVDATFDNACQNGFDQ